MGREPAPQDRRMRLCRWHTEESEPPPGPTYLPTTANAHTGPFYLSNIRPELSLCPIAHRLNLKMSLSKAQGRMRMLKQQTNFTINWVFTAH